MEPLNRSEKFVTYKKETGLVAYIHKMVKWIEELYSNIVKRVNHNLGMTASKTWNPASVSVNGTDSTTITVTGANLGDFALASFSADTQGMIIEAHVTDEDEVTVIFTNNTGGAIDLAEGTVRVWVRPK